MADNQDLLVALAGQQNAGKSTLFNVLTGARQHVANYPGVTVDKKYGVYRDAGGKVTAVDLPGTYSLTSFSLEERVARDFLLDERPDVTVNVVDGSTLHRSLHLTVQILEMELPTVLAVNMMDVVEQRGLTIDLDKLSRRLGLPVVTTVGRKGLGRETLRGAIRGVDPATAKPAPPVDYGPLETDIAAIAERISEHPQLADLPRRWLALKLIETDARVDEIVAARLDATTAEALTRDAATRAKSFAEANGVDVGDHVASCRDRAVAGLLSGVITGDTGIAATSITDRIDKLVLNRWMAPLVLVLTVFMIYQIAIVWGYEVTNYTWPILAGAREIIAGFLPDAGFLIDPYVRSMGLWLVDSANTLLNYVPIFLILFALIAMLEDSGYMARIAFILDKVLHRYGLHGQSTLPLILGGVFAGGCAVPGVMATKGIPDTRARMATIFAVPFMNCLAKVPLYTLLLGIFFVENKSLMMFYISTITIIFALLVSKLLTQTVLRGQETSPFVMELPTYHLPTLIGVLRRAVDRTWLYIKKVGTIVVAVAVIVFTLLQFPGLPEDRSAHYDNEARAAIGTFEAAVAGTPYAEAAEGEKLVDLVNFYNDYKRAKLNATSAEASDAVSQRFEARNAAFLAMVKPPAEDAAAKTANRALRALDKTRNRLRREMKEERIETSLLGIVGRGLEPVTQFAGFDWKINVALLSSFAARESSVATLGVLFQQDEDQNATLEQRMGAETQAGGATALLAVSMILFFALYPPCLATTVMVKVQTGSYKWMLFSIVFPTILGLAVSSAVYTTGRVTGASGIQMMTAVYLTSFALLLVVGLVGGRRRSAMLDAAMRKAG